MSSNATLSKKRSSGKVSPSDGDQVEPLYFEFIKRFYGEGNRAQTKKLAPRLEAALAASPNYEGSIRAEEIRSLLAELRGDYLEAARCREAEIRKILELHTLTANTPGWDYIARQYDFQDVSDRLDLLALLYDQQGELDRAIATLLESKLYCESHHIAFDGQDILDELEQAKAGLAKRTSKGERRTRRVR